MAWVVLGTSIAACDARGCLPSEKVVIIYRGATPIEVEAPVIRDDKTVGVVFEVHAGDGAQRVVVTLPSASALRQNDRYLPFRSADKAGFKVVPGGGAPLQNGDVVEAGFRSQPQPAPDPLTPSTTGNMPPRRESSPAWHAIQPEQDVRSAGIQNGNVEHVPLAVRRRPAEIAAAARQLPPDEAIAYLTRELEAVPAEFDAAIQEARDRGDRAAVSQIRALRIKTVGMINRMRVQASKNR